MNLFKQRKAEYEEAYEAERQRKKQLYEYQQLQKSVSNPVNTPVQVNSRCTLSMSDRLAVIGMSGVGKTTFALQLIPRVRQWWDVPVIIFDTKGQGEFNDIATELSLSQTAPALPSSGVFVWQPPADNLNEYDAFLGKILKGHKPAFVVIDELSNFGRGSPNSYVNNYTLLQKQGRGLKILTLSMVQEFAAIPRQTVGQASHLFRFHLLNDYDRRKMSGLLGLPDAEKLLEPPFPYGFFYRRLDKPSPVYAYQNWQQFFIPPVLERKRVHG